MRKLGVEEWLVSAVMSMYTGAKTVVRTVYGNSNGFEIKVDMHQGSALSPLLFVMVMEALCREFRVALPWELLYADDLVVIAETEEDCKKWVHRKCGGIKGSMYKVMKSFICRGCVNPVTGTERTSVDIDGDANLELVDKFCYLGDMLSVDGDADGAVETRI